MVDGCQVLNAGRYALLWSKINYVSKKLNFVVVCRDVLEGEMRVSCVKG